MGFIRKISGAQASKDAARIQAASGEKAIDQLRAELRPYAAGGVDALNRMNELSTQEGQQAFLENDQTYQDIQGFERTSNLDSAMDETERRLNQRQASQGRLNSGSTVVDLTRQLHDVQTQDDNLRFNDLLAKAASKTGVLMDNFNMNSGVAGIGANAAAGLGSQTAAITQGIGNAQAAGEIGQANAMRGFWGGAAGLALGAAGGPAGVASGLGGMFKQAPPLPNYGSHMPTNFDYKFGG